MSEQALLNEGCETLSWLTTAGAHHDVITWARVHGRDWSTLWTECPRGDWLLAIAARAGVAHDKLLRATVACVPVLEPYLPADEPVVQQALGHVRRLASAVDASDVGASTEEERAELSAAIDERASSQRDHSAQAAVVAVGYLLATIDDQEAAAMCAATIAQAAVLDAGDCAMMQAARYTQHACAEQVRGVLSLGDVLERVR